MANCFCGCGRKVKLLDRAINSQGRGILDGILRIESTDNVSIEMSPGFRFDSLEEFCDVGGQLALRMKALVHREIDPVASDRQASREWYSSWNAIQFLSPASIDPTWESEQREAFREGGIPGPGAGWA